MRPFSVTVAATLTLLTWAPSAIATPDPGTLHFKFEKRAVAKSPKDATQQLWERQSGGGTVNVPIDNYQLLYLINITVGNPGQELQLQLDTGSSDIWFPAAASDPCQAGAEYCPLGAFDPNSSESASPLSDLPPFRISYVDGSAVGGIYFTDDLTIGESTITNTTMALATQFDRGIGVMGIGFREGESSNFLRQNPFTYPNVVNLLVEQGLTESTSYSLWLDDLQSNTGSILFGGVDTDKYTGNLVSLPIQPDAGSTTSNPLFTAFTVAWTGLSITGNDNDVDLSPETPQPVIFDSGTTLTFLPDAIAQRLITGFGAVALRSGLYALPCSVGNNDITWTFTFGGSDAARIAVPVSEMVIPLTTRTGDPVVFEGEEICRLGIIPAGDNPLLFGDTFLRSAYVVYDLDNLQIGLAQTNFDSNPGTGNVQAISSGSGIPDVTLTASAATVDNTYTGGVGPVTAGPTDVTVDPAQATGDATFKLSSPTGSNSGGDDNAAGRPSADRSLLAALVVSVGAFVFGAMLI